MNLDDKSVSRRRFFTVAAMGGLMAGTAVAADEKKPAEKKPDEKKPDEKKIDPDRMLGDKHTCRGQEIVGSAPGLQQVDKTQANDKNHGRRIHQRTVEHMWKLLASVSSQQSSRPGRAQQIPIAQHHRLHAADGERGRSVARAHDTASRCSPRPRATSRNTSSSVSRP